MKPITVPYATVPIGIADDGTNVRTHPEFVRFFEALVGRLGVTGSTSADVAAQANQALFLALKNPVPQEDKRQAALFAQTVIGRQQDANDAKLVAPNRFTRAQAVTPMALTDAANIATDASQSNHFAVTLGGNRTLDNPTNLVNGVILNWKVKQDGTGSRTLAYGSKFKWPSGTVPTLTTTAAAVDYISVQYFSDDDILIASIVKDIR